MKRLSSYSILSTRMGNGGYVLLNSLSGAVEVLSDELAYILSEKMETADYREIYLDADRWPAELVSLLSQRGHLTALPHAKEQEQLELLAAELHEAANSQKQAVIVPRIDCNYRCVYCFERPLQNKLNPNSKLVMDVPAVDQVFAAIAKLQNKGEAITPSILLYGGEPLNSAGKAIVKEIVKRGCIAGFDFQAITNGHDLEVYLPILGCGQISSIQVSLDGPKSIHDRRRVSRDGYSSYEKIMANLRRVLKETDTRVQIRINVDQHNLRIFPEIFEAFDQEGWLNNERVMICVSLVFLKDKKGEVHAQTEVMDLAIILKPFTDVYSNVLVGSAESILDLLLVSSIAANRPYQRRTNFCSAASGMFIFLPDGEIHACWDSIGQACSRLGSFNGNQGLQLDTEACNHWFGRSVTKIPECAACRYCLVCGGGCPQYAQYNSGSLYEPFCNNFQTTYPQVLAQTVERILKSVQS